MTTSTGPGRVDRSVTALVVAVLVGYALLGYAAVAPGLNVVGALLGLVLTLGVLALQGTISRPGRSLTRGGAAIALLALACLVYVPVFVLGGTWLAFAGFLAGSLLLLLPSRPGLAGFAVVAVSVGLLALVALGAPLLVAVTSAVGTAVTGLVIHGLTRYLHVTTAAGAAPAVAEPSVEEPAVAEPAVPEPVEEPAVAEPAVAPTPAPLADELRVARSSSVDADIEFSVLGEDVELPEEVAEAFAALVRVAVGHATRHPGATTCHVTVVRRESEARVVVTHDGATDDPDPADFESLGERFDALEGSVLAERDDEQFTVDGRLPLGARSDDPRASTLGGPTAEDTTEDAR